METKPEGSTASTPTGDRPRRVIKRYSNRKLYDTKDSRYVTLVQIAEMVRRSEDVQIIDNNSKEDLTEITLAQIIYEEQKARSRYVPLQTLKELIHSRTEKVLSDLREGPIGRLIPGTKPEGKSEPQKVDAKGVGSDGQARKETLLEDGQQKIDERIEAILPSLAAWQALQNDVKRLSQRVEELDRKFKGK